MTAASPALPNQQPIRPARAWLAGAAVAGVAAAAWFVQGHDPRIAPVYPACPVHAATGLHCPGCGSTRTLHALLNLDLAAAWQANPLLLLLLPVLVPALALELLAWVAPGRAVPRLRPSARVSRALVIAVIAFGVLRNLPVPPFAWLAPV